MNDTLLVPLAILVSSFIGSWHCAGMCGPFAALSGGRGQLWHYHAGRGLAYFVLGAVAGSFGELILSNSFHWLRDAGAVILGGMLIAMGLKYHRGKSLLNIHTQAGRHFQNLYRKIARYQFSRSSFVIGLMAGLLPCMWLYTYVLAAAASKSSFGGGLVMTLFWLGSLPALSAVSMMVRPSLRHAGAQKQKIAGMVLTLAGIYALISHFTFHA